MMMNEKDLARMVEEVQGMPAGTKTEIFLDTETGKITSVFCWTTNEFHEKDDDELLIEVFPSEIDYLFKDYDEGYAIKAVEELIVGKIEAAEEEAEW